MHDLKKIGNLLILLMLFFASCDDRAVKDTQTAGQIAVSVDETYKPIMEEQFRVFMSRYPEAKINASYKPESECIKDYLEDSTRVIFITRDLTKEEKDYALSKQLVTRSLPMARDALAIIMSKDNTEPKFTQAELVAILTGADKNHDYQVVFDNTGSSTVRFITDSVLSKNQALSKNVFATKSSQEVVDYVSKNPTAIGIIGVNYVSDYKDSTAENFLQQINVASIQPNGSKDGKYIKPYLAYIGLREYPFTRNLFFVSKETWPGLGTGLVNYLCRDGQILFKQAKLFPLQSNVFLRETRVH